MKKKLKLIIILIVFVLKGFAQNPFITNFPAEIYKAATQNWAVVQDKRGVLFFGNNDGLLEYDGVSWRLIDTPGAVLSLGIDNFGKIYVGSESNFGYLKTDSLGFYQYKSLKDKIPSKDLEFSDIWDIYVLGNQVIFQSYEKIFVLHDDKLKVINPDESFHFSFAVNNTFYVREQGKGLMIYNDGILQLMKSGERFADEKIDELLPYNQNEILIFSRTQGIWIYNSSKNKIYKPKGFESVDKYLLQHLVYCSTLLKNGSFAIGTLTGGILVFNQQGIIQNVYNNSNGLQDNSVLSLYEDKHHQLWACTSNGISLVQNNLPFQKYSEKHGLKGKVMFVEYFNNTLYVGTMQHLFVLNAAGYFETIPGTEGQNWQLTQTNGTLLLANINGLFEIKEKQSHPVTTTTGFASMSKINDKPAYLLAGSISGLILFVYDQKIWKTKNIIKGFNKPVYKIVPDKEGVIWVYTNPELYQLRLNESMDSAISIMQCTVKIGLPQNMAIPFELNSGEVVFGSKNGIYRYISATGTFEKHSDFSMINDFSYPFQQQKNGDIWFQNKKSRDICETGVLKYNNGNYQLINQPFYKFSDYSIEGLQDFCVKSDSIVFVGTNEGLLQYNPMLKVDYNIPYNTIIRKVLAKDSLLFGGATHNPSEFANIQGSEIPYSQNNLMFHYAATFYEDVEKNLFSYRLIGSDTTWSAWVSDVKKEFTNLYEGEYSFEVRAQNQYKVIGSTASYSFRILAPWHRTFWAYTLYLLFFIGLGFAILKMYTRRLITQKIHLEKVVIERTAEIMQQKEEISLTLEVLSQQKEEIHNQNIELNEHKKNLEVKIQERTIQLEIAKNKAEESDRLKSSFLQNISHEVRTPLNAIAGFSQLMTYTEQTPEDLKKYTELILSSSDKLIEIITDVIEISQIQSKITKLNLAEFDIISLLNEIINKFKNKAKDKDVEIIVNLDIPFQEYFIQSDIEKLQRIFIHLFDNAIKFTHHGKIEIICKLENDKINFTISDTGIGISEEMQNIIFEPFRQVETGMKRNFGGNGLGLSLAKDYMELMNGSISLKSERNKGTTIYISIPTNKSEKQLDKPLPDNKKYAVKTILIVEDEYSNYQYLSILLKKTDFKVLYATNGQEAVDLCRNNAAIDLILMDIKMPIMDGQTAAKIIKGFRSDIIIIAQTAFALESERDSFIEFFDDYITKPIKRELLYQKLMIFS